uniref:Uncharacterized protein n=1 Tax=Aegilops tauschii subsp. strangulata TaxID=200361 RepID=A0A453FVS9_AEGTS
RSKLRTNFLPLVIRGPIIHARKEPLCSLPSLEKRQSTPRALRGFIEIGDPPFLLQGKERKNIRLPPGDVRQLRLACANILNSCS